MTSVWGRYRVHMASMSSTPAARAAATSSRASVALRVNAFSTSTCLPARSASRAWSRWWLCGLAT